MRFNDHALRQVARTVQPDKEGRLNYRAPKDSTYVVRWNHNCVENRVPQWRIQKGRDFVATPPGPPSCPLP